LVQSLAVDWQAPAGYERFEIRHSENGGAKTALILPDVGTCDDCLREIRDPGDRRYGYPFTNCTNCGPRFTIIEALPYDRPNTTMSRFVMCPECRREYEAPLDRRFHAQPNACPSCGPQLRYFERGGDRGRDGQAAGDPLKLAAEALRAGKIIAVKGLGGFHLMCDARSDAAVALLRQRKPRRERPFAIMAPDLEWVRAHCELSPEAEALLTSPEAPITLLRRKPEVRLGAVCPCVAPDNPNLGVMLPYTPLHHLLMEALGFAVVATSGNLSDEPICIDEDEAVARLGHIADAFLAHDRPIQRHADDSIAWVSAGQPRLLRRARGFAPLPVLLKREGPTILAVGPHLKNTVSLSVGRQVFISQHIGDLESPEALGAFERVIEDFLRLYEATPAAIAHDLHPHYASTIWARERGGRLIGVQHHHAHLAACLAENQVEGSALGVIWDGTGYGTDGTIWGGEFLLGDAQGFQRAARLRPFRLPGADAAVHEPRRVALALLYELFGEAAFEMDVPPLRTTRPAERPILAQMLARGINAPVTTSMGRLFDGIAALIGLRQIVSYEGQAAMRMEFAADERERDAYPMRFSDGLLDWGDAVLAALTDYQAGATPATISARFHNGLVTAIVEIARSCGEPRVALSGGCFQNRLLTERATAALRDAGFDVLLHRQTPPNDGCVSLGQAVVAAAHLG
jgi:hydrogenase maturation protein HypF